MAAKGSGKIAISRAVYDPPIREAIVAGDVDHMRALLQQAKQVYAEQGDLKRAITRLELAIKAAE